MATKIDPIMLDLSGSPVIADTNISTAVNGNLSSTSLRGQLTELDTEKALISGSIAQAFHCSNLGFPSTQVASSNVNTLDDYEEGSWTPILQASSGGVAGSYNAQTGFYIKIGAMVFTFCTVAAAKNTLSGNVQVGGLPYISKSGATSGGSVYRAYGLAINAGENIMVELQNAGSYFNIHHWDTTAGTSYLQYASDVGTTVGIYAQFVYQTT